MNSRDRIGILMDCARATGFPGRTGQFLEEHIIRINGGMLMEVKVTSEL